MKVFVARQPIFDKDQKVYGYELLYRLGEENYYSSSDGDMATSEVIANTFLLMGIETLTGGKLAFINFTENLLKKQVPAMLPSGLVAIEILEDVICNEEIVTACRQLKEKGYTLVLDDFIDNGSCKPLVEMADIIKIDFMNTTFQQCGEITKRVGTGHTKFLAEKVETREMFEQAVSMGYSYFQGYFFAKPTILSSQDVPVYKVNYLHVLQEINRSDMDFNRLESIIKRDVSLSYKLLKYINSAAFGFRTRIESIKHALVMLGVTEIKKWVSLIALRNMADDKPSEILTSSVVRARFAELLAVEVGLQQKSSDLFIMGLFSMIDALIGRPMKILLNDLPIADEIKNALLGKSGGYREVLELVLAYEKAEWESFALIAEQLGLKQEEVPRLYVHSLEWSDQLFNVVR